MRILCLIESLGSGGAERQLSGLASMLKGEGHDVKVITYYSKNFYRHVLDHAGVEFEYLPSALNKINRIPLLARAIRSYIPDVVIAYSPSAAEIVCLLKVMGFKYKLIVSERNTSQNNDRREKIKFFFYKWADHIVPNSNMQARFIKEYYPHLLSKTKIITNFVDTDFFCPCEPHGVNNRICRIMCVGRDHPQKNILRFIEAIHKLVHKGLLLKVEWYGRFESSYGELCKSKVMELGLGQCFIFKGETAEIRDEYWKHDIFCLPSNFEGYPNVLCEAMSCGLPVVCSDVCDNPLIVKEGINGFLFDPKSVENMALKIENFVMLDEAEKNRMRLANRKLAVELFSSKIFLSKYNSLLEG